MVIALESYLKQETVSLSIRCLGFHLPPHTVFQIAVFPLGHQPLNFPPYCLPLHNYETRLKAKFPNDNYEAFGIGTQFFLGLKKVHQYSRKQTVLVS